MVTVDTGSAARQRRRTWVLGGALLVASALVQLAAQGSLAPLYRAADVLFAAGALVLVIGIGRAGSVTARRPLGTGAVVALVVVLLVAPYLSSTLLTGIAPAPGTISGYQIFFWIQLAVSLMLAILAATQIGRAGVVPQPWNWAPLWALGAVTLAQLIPMAPFWAPLLGSGQDPSALLGLFSVFGLVRPLAIAFLGIVAIVLGTRSAPGSVAVYSSNAG